MSKRAGKKRTPEIEREQFEAYGEYTYDYLHAQDGDAGDAQAPAQPSVQAVRRAQKRRRTHGFFKFLGLLTVLTIGLAVGQQTLFRLETVYVVGNVEKTPQEVVMASGLVRGRNMITIEEEDVAKALSQDHTIIFKGMQKEYPNTIYLYIEERKTVAAMQWLGILYTLDREGVVMEESTSTTPPAGMPVITGFRVSNINVGQRLTVRSEKQMDAYREIMEELELGVGDEIEVYKANMIIPQIARNLTRSGVRDIPAVCPVCGGKTQIRQEGNAKTLYCTNPECQAKHVKAFTLFVSRDAMNIEGLSESTLEKFIARGFIREYADIFHLYRHRDEIQSMEGFGEKSFQNLEASIEKARTTTLPRVIYGLGIANIGLANARMICRAFDYELDRMLAADQEDLSEISGIGEVIAGAFVAYFQDPVHRRRLEDLLKELSIVEEEGAGAPQTLAGLTFVITGSVTHFANRSEVKTLIESLGGKVTGSVTSKTDYLINNDVESTSSKNKKARELGIPILSEEEFLEMTQGEGQ